MAGKQKTLEAQIIAARDKLLSGTQSQWWSVVSWEISQRASRDMFYKSRPNHYSLFGNISISWEEFLNGQS